MTAARSCPGDLLAGLVDGRLDHQARERVQRHLVGCPDCRAERSGQADLKALLRATPAPPVSEQLVARLLGLAVPEVDPAPDPAVLRRPPGQLPGDCSPLRSSPRRLPARLVLAGSGAALSSTGRRMRLRPTSQLRPNSQPRLTGRQRLGLGGCLVVVSFGTAFALGAPRAQTPVVRLDPSTEVFVADYAGVTSEVPVTAGVSTGGTAGR